jgi:hypothetical protein
LQKLLNTTELVRVATQRKPEIVDFDLLAARIAGVGGGFVAHFQDEVGDDFV